MASASLPSSLTQPRAPPLQVMDGEFRSLDRPLHKVLTYVEYKAVSGVSQNIDPPPPSPPRECVLPPHQSRGEDTLAGRWEGGGSIFWKTPDIELASYSIIPLRSSSTIPAPEITEAEAKAVVADEALQLPTALHDYILSCSDEHFIKFYP
jgi:hypothetical protein